MRELEIGKSNAEVAREYGIGESQISKWYKAYRKDGDNAFQRKKQTNKEAAKIAELERIVGRLHIENDILKRVSGVLGGKLRQLRKS